MKIDLNSDLGEHSGGLELGSDLAMIELVTSANIACGFHAGDPRSIFDTLQAAARQGVTVGAHVSYPDREGFGRRPMEIEDAALEADVIYQIGGLESLARAAGTRVSYVKPHGALYNAIATNERQAAAVIRAVKRMNPDLPLVCLAAAPIVEQVRSEGLRAVPEAFADRMYQENGLLVSRSEEGAVLHDPILVAKRMLQLVKFGTVPSREGALVTVNAESICVHGDSAGALQMAKAVRHQLEAEQIDIVSFMSAA
ncbi:MAG: LamB/YcsF family protein [Gulosibacter sp.]|uniref:LamB/YcsF family protein n=1 Tax=Gulosibacter sp. TaxID=2817531 RepID=UPI003F913BEF